MQRLHLERTPTEQLQSIKNLTRRDEKPRNEVSKKEISRRREVGRRRTRRSREPGRDHRTLTREGEFVRLRERFLGIRRAPVAPPVPPRKLRPPTLESDEGNRSRDGRNFERRDEGGRTGSHLIGQFVTTSLLRTQEVPFEGPAVRTGTRGPRHYVGFIERNWDQC